MSLTNDYLSLPLLRRIVHYNVTLLFQIKMWTKLAAPSAKMKGKAKVKKEPGNSKPQLPDWLEKYVEYRFSLYDRTSK